MANKILAQLLELPIPEDQTRASLRFLGDELNSTDIGTEKFKKIKLKLIDLGIPEDIPDKYFGKPSANKPIYYFNRCESDFL